MDFNANPGRKFSILGIVFACLAWVVLPIAFGPLAVIFGIVGALKGDIKFGIIAIILGRLFALASSLIGLYEIVRMTH